MTNHQNQLTLISRQSQEEKRKTLMDSVKKTVCNRKTSSLTWTLPSPHSYFRFNPREFVRDHLTKGDRLVLNHLVYLSQIYKHVFVSQSTIGRAIGYTREEVCRIVRKLRAYGLLRTIYRHWQPSIYKLSSLFRLKRVINKISSFITSLGIERYQNNLTQLNYLVSSKLNSYRKSCSSSYLTKRAHGQNGSFFTQLTKHNQNCPPPVRPYRRKGMVMTKEDIAARVKAIEEIAKTLDLSRYGKANLSIFPDSALRVAHDKLIKSYQKPLRLSTRYCP